MESRKNVALVMVIDASIIPPSRFLLLYRTAADIAAAKPRWPRSWQSAAVYVGDLVESSKSVP